MNTSTFPLTGKRHRRDLVACQNLYFRIGVGPSTGPGKRSIPGYGNEAVAESAPEAFVHDAPLPRPTMIVGCGDELQVYWSFTEVFTPGAFARLSRALALAGRRLGLKFHAPSTRDPCCLMRIPGTLNYQIDPPAPITLRVTGDDVTKEQMTKALRAWLPRDWGRKFSSGESRAQARDAADMIRRINQRLAARKAARNWRRAV